MITTFLTWALYWIATGVISVLIHKGIKEPSRIFRDSEAYFWGAVVGFITPVLLIIAYLYELYKYLRR